MKRIVTLLLAAGLVLGAAGAGNAADVKAKGTWDFAFGWSNNTLKEANGGKDYFKALQRLRTQVDFIASESLKGVVFFEIGDQNWGRADQGASLGTDGTVIEVRYSYIDWVVPDTDLKVRMGLQPVAFPGYVAGSTVLNHDAAAITLNYNFNENVGATLFWSRLENDNPRTDEGDVPWEQVTVRDNLRHDAFDLFGLIVPLTFDGVKVSPWGAYASIGKYAFADDGGAGHAAGNGTQLGRLQRGMTPVGSLTDGQFDNPSESRGDAWWLGLTGDITVWNPFRLAFDFNYGYADLGRGTIRSVREDGTNVVRHGEGDLKRRGWMASLLAEYKLDFATPGLMLWYGSGDDDDPYNGSERLPTMRANWNPTSYGFGDYVIDTGEVLSNSAAGTMGVVAQLKNITFMEDLSHVLRVAYFRGTNDARMAGQGFAPNPFYNGGECYLTEKDGAFEVDFDTTYKIYEDLSVRLALAYIYLDIDEDIWERGGRTIDANKNNFKAFVNMQYTF